MTRKSQKDGHLPSITGSFHLPESVATCKLVVYAQSQNVALNSPSFVGYKSETVAKNAEWTASDGRGKPSQVEDTATSAGDARGIIFATRGGGLLLAAARCKPR